MVEASFPILGPLVVPECRRAVARGWIILVRTITACAALLVAVSVIWAAETARELDPTFQPPAYLRVGLAILEWMAVTTALLLAPAVMAGSLAGEKERGSLGLLLTTRVNALEIVTGRMSGKVSQVAMMVLSMSPGLILLAALAGFRIGEIAVLIGLPLSVGFGAAGASALASSLSRRGRDALLVIYLLTVLVSVVPSLGTPGTLLALAAPLNPLSGILSLTRDDAPATALTTIALWLAAGVAGLLLASWRLRPSCLRQIGGETKGKKARRFLVPAIGERPMLWKELYIDRVGSVGRAGRWIGGIITLSLLVAGVAMAVLAGLGANYELDPGISGWYGWLRGVMFSTSVPLLCLIQWGVGLRAAVTISSERERGTWDGLLTSPLEGGEIVRGKLWGSLFALRWLLLATFWAWGVAWACGAFTWDYILVLSLHILIVGAFMAAVGVRSSLATGTATRSMAITIGVWLGSYAAAAAAGLIVAIILILFGVLCWFLSTALGLMSANSRPAFIPYLFGIGFQGTMLGGLLAATLMIVSEARLRFDRIAGRLSGGELEVAVDQFLKGTPLAPISEAALRGDAIPPSVAETDELEVVAPEAVSGRPSA